jgi:hypothetical protein
MKMTDFWDTAPCSLVEVEASLIHKILHPFLMVDFVICIYLAFGLMVENN